MASSLLRTAKGASGILRSRIPAAARPVASVLPFQCQQSRAQSHAVSAPMLADIEKRWEVMPPQEQAELWMALRDRMKGYWGELTLQEKKACECFFSSTAFYQFGIYIYQGLDV